MQLFILYEHAAGYALFRTSECEEIARFVPEVRRSISDINKFRSIAFLVAFQKFKTREEAVENAKCVSGGKLHRDLSLFLESNVPKSKKSLQSVVLGVQDADLASGIADTLGMECKTSEVVREICRGIRTHFHKFIKGFADSQTATKSQLSLGHQYCRFKLNLSVNKYDTLVTESMKMTDQLEKDIRTLGLRITHWYSFHFPELIKIIPDITTYIQCVKLMKDRKNLPDNIEDELQSILKDSDKVMEVLKAAHSSMGMDIAEEDVENIQAFVEQVVSLSNCRHKMSGYLKDRMHKIAPNLSTLIGEEIGARLISQAGNLSNLAKLPASTVQILGAEKSLFRTLKKRKNTEKFKNLNKLAVVAKADKAKRGRMPRCLANKCSLAARKDCFSDSTSDSFGQELKNLVDERENFYETGKFTAEITTPLSAEALAVKRAALRRRKRERRRLLKSKVSDHILPATEEKIEATKKTEEGSPPISDNLVDVPETKVATNVRAKSLTENVCDEQKSQEVVSNLDKLPDVPKIKRNTKRKAKELTENVPEAISSTAENATPPNERRKKSLRKRK